MILGLQLISFIFAFIMIYFAYINFRKKEISKLDFYIWFFIWTTTILVIFFPELLRDFAGRFFITRLFDLMVIIGFILLISMTARTYVQSNKLEKKMEDFLRQDAIKKATYPRKKSSKKK